MGCGLSKFDEKEREPNPEVRFVYPRNEAPIVNDKDVGDELGESEECSNNNSRKSLSVETGFMKKAFGNAHEKGREKDAEGDQGGRRSISSASPRIMKNGLFAKESRSFGKYRESLPDENLKWLNSMDKVNSVDMRFSVEMAKEEARRISSAMAVKEAERIKAEVAKEQERLYYTNLTMEDAKMTYSTKVVKEDPRMPYNVDQLGKEQKYGNEEKEGTEDEYLRENSLLFPPGSPSFRIYCLLDKDCNDNAEDDEQEIPGSKLPPKLPPTGRVKTTKRRRKTTSLLRSVLHRGGSATSVKNFLHIKHSTFTQDSSHSKLSA